MNTPKDLRYTKTHEWVRVEQEQIVVGITAFAQEQLSDLTYIELPSEGDEVSAQDEIAVIESVKAASDIYAPVSGTITAVNDALANSPEIVNGDPYEEGWLFKMKPTNAADVETLMDVDEYEELLPGD